MEFTSDGSAQPAAAAEAGTPEGGSAPAAESGVAEAGNADFLSALSEDTRKLAEARGWTTADKMPDAIKSYQELQQKMGSSLTPPGKDASPEDVAAFYSKASESWGKVDAEKHQFSMPDGLPENMPYDGDFAKQAAKWFADAGIPAHVAQSLHDSFVQHQAGVFTQMEKQALDAKQAQEDAAAAAHRELTKQFGPEDSDGYKVAAVKAQRAADNLGLREWMTEKGILSKPDAQGNQAVLDAKIFGPLVKVFDGMMKEDGVSMSQVLGQNPFAKDTLNLRDQADLIKNNPDAARQMIEAAGKDPTKFGL